MTGPGSATPGPGDGSAASVPPAGEPDDVARAGLERTLSLAVIGGSVVAFILILALVPPFNPTFDDAKYVGIGRNVLAGLGPVTVFGIRFLNHSPLWPLAMAIPERLVGVDALSVGHLLNGLSGGVVIALGGALGWRIRPLAGAVTAIALVGFVYLGDLGRTAGLDLPAAALTLGYLLVGLAAARRGSIWLGIAAGALFALAFLMKEIALPWAPAPFLAAIFWTMSWVRLARAAGWALGVAAVGLSWWFAIYAADTNSVYRLGTPGWTLVPLALLVAFSAVGLAASDRLAGGRVGRILGTTRDRAPAVLRRHGRALAGWGLTGAWLVLLLVVFWRTPKLLGAGLLNRDQLVSYAGHLLLSVKLTVALAALGWLLALIGWLRHEIDSDPPRDLIVAGLCGLPLVLLVAAIGETPRHYVVEITLGVALGAAGWAWAILAVAGRVAGWSFRRWSTVVAGLLVVVFVTATGILAVHARGAYLERDRLEEAAAASARAWLRTNAKPGDTVAFGPYLGYEIALDLPSGVRAVRIRPQLLTVDPTAPLGLRSGANRPNDVVSLDDAAGKANQFDAYTAGQLQRAIAASSVDYIVYPISEASSAAGVLGALTPAAGADLVGSWRQAGSGDTIDMLIYRIGPTGLQPDASRMVATPQALDRLTTHLESQPAAARAAAGALLDRLVTGDPALDPIVARLTRLAGR